MHKRIFVAIDSSATAQKALDEAIVLAKAMGADLCVATALDEAALDQHGMGLGSYIDVDKVKEQATRCSRRRWPRRLRRVAGPSRCCWSRRSGASPR